MLEKDEALSRALVPEVWQVVRKEGGGGRHEQERRKFLRIQVLREVTLSSRQSIGLEPWGRMKVEYDGLDASLAVDSANTRSRSACPPTTCATVSPACSTTCGASACCTTPSERSSPSTGWTATSRFSRATCRSSATRSAPSCVEARHEKAELVTQWLSERGDTTIRQMAKKWGVAGRSRREFLEGLFEFLDRSDSC